MKPRARIENWYVGENDLIYGEVYNHPEIPDGTFVQTSRIVYLDKHDNVAVTRNTEYELGRPLK